MSFSELNEGDAVRRAVEEFDSLGREAFLERYGFGRSKEYFLDWNGKLYDSKAIVGVAHKYQFPEQGALTPGDFSAGEITVKRKLESLGFFVQVKHSPTIEPGKILSNSELSRAFHCSTQGGMRKSTRINALIIISNHVESVYEDRWERDTFYYTGMGLKGDQSLSFMQNKTLAESNKSSIGVHLFEVFEPNKYVYQGKAILAEKPFQEKQLDSSGKLRTVWIFPLRLADKNAMPLVTEETFNKKQERREKRASRLSDQELSHKANKAPRKPGERQVVSKQFERNEYVAELARRRANGICQLCNDPAPFRDKTGAPFLEVHHIQWLSRDGEDVIENTVGLCPNCHRRMHMLDNETDKRLLRKKGQVTGA